MALSAAAAARKDATTQGDFQHRHFATIARIIAAMATVHNGENGFIDVREDVAHHFADELASTNPRFDRARFLAACKVQY